jgi:hypothetical protein
MDFSTEACPKYFEHSSKKKKKEAYIIRLITECRSGHHYSYQSHWYVTVDTTALKFALSGCITMSCNWLYRRFPERGNRASPILIGTCWRYLTMACGSHGLPQQRYCLLSHGFTACAAHRCVSVLRSQVISTFQRVPLLLINILKWLERG